MVYGFLYYARVFIRPDLKKLTNDKHSSLLRKSVIYRQKSFITLSPQNDTHQNDTHQNETYQNDTRQNDTYQNDTYQNDTH